MEYSFKFEIIRNSTNEKLNQLVDQFIACWEDSSDVIETMTSGSTGKPKAIKLKKEYMVRSAENTLKFLQIKPGTSSLLCLSPETIAGKMMIVRSIVGKMKLIIGDLSANPMKELEDTIDLLAIVPLQLERICEENLSKLKQVKHCIVGGGPVSEKLIEVLKNEKISVYHSYGMTETISHVALRQIGFMSEDSFHALPGVDFHLNDKQLVIHYPEIGINALQTNDCVDLLSNKAFIWLGRSDFVINSGGIKIHPERVEKVLSPILSVPFFVCGISDDRLGQKLVLCIESEEKIKIDFSLVQNQLQKYHNPKEIYYIPNFVWTKSGKINRKETINKLTKNVLREVL